MCRETEAERDAGVQNSVVITQLIESIPKGVDYARLVVAYEPIWAIGTGKTATIEDIKAMHGVIRKYLNESWTILPQSVFCTAAR